MHCGGLGQRAKLGCGRSPHWGGRGQTRAAMPRYYIDLKGHFGTTEDPTGIEVPNVAAAQTEALKVAERLLNNWEAVSPKYRDEIFIEVINEQLRPVLIVSLSEFVTDTAVSKPPRRSPLRSPLGGLSSFQGISKLLRRS